MKKPLIRWGFHQKRWYAFWWTFGVSAATAIQLGFYPAFKDQFDQLNKTIASLPAGVKGLIGDTGTYFSPETYLNSRVYYLIPLLFGSMMIGLGSSLLAREEDDKTVELLLSRPVSRSRLLAGKALLGLLITGIVTMVSLVICVALSKAVGIPNSPVEIAAAMLLTYLLCLVFGAFAFMLTAVGRATRALSMGLTTFLFLASFILTGLTGAAEWLKWPASLLPYDYYEPQRMLSGQYDWATVAGYAFVIAICGFIAWLGFRQRDIS